MRHGGRNEHGMRFLLIALLAGSCLALTDLEQQVIAAVQEAQANIQARNGNVQTIKEDGSGVSQTQKASIESQMEQMRGDMLMEITKILVAKYGQEIIPQLENIDIEALLGISRKKRYAETPSPAPGTCKKESTDCTVRADIRSITGVCNNRRNPSAGKAVTAVRRLKGTASYADGIGAIRSKSTTGSPLPSTRDISNRLHSEGSSPAIFDMATNHLHMQYGQFIAHDVIFMPSSVGPNGETLDCSACNSSSVTDNCAPIVVPDGDTYFPKKSCIRLTRALNAQKGLGQRQQINQNTHFLDLSAVYGSDECVAASVRTFQGGELKQFNNGYVLPPQAPNDTNCQSKNPYYCFLAGDFRNSLHPGLIPLHVVYIKEHNRIARLMRNLRPDFNDERIYQETRRLVIASYQYHVYSEYLPKLLGKQTMDEFDLTPKSSGYFTGYSETVTPALSAEFSAAAFRLHTQTRADFPRVDNNNKDVDTSVSLGSNIFYADSLYDRAAGGTESMLEGMMQRPAMALDKQFSFPIRNQLFEKRGMMASGVDLVAVNLMRGRDVGLFPYNEYRTIVGLPKATSFDDLLGQMDSANVQALKSVYANVNDIDLYSGILMERPANGAMIGRTGAYIIAETFAALKKGDRFFYESSVTNSRGLTPPELAAIRSSNLAKVMCGVTSSMAKVNKNAFDLNSQKVTCDSLTDIDLTPFVGNAGASMPPPPPGTAPPPPGSAPPRPPPPPPSPPPRRRRGN